MPNKTKYCPKCKQDKDWEKNFYNSGWCNECRSKRDRTKDTELARIKKYPKRCIYCELHKHLIHKNICKTCLERSGHKLCIKCNKIKKLVDFYKTKSRCKKCYA